MRAVTAWALLLALAAATPAFAQTPAHDTDHAYQLLGGWACESDAHSRALWTFTRNADGAIALKNEYRTPVGAFGEFDETYRFDATTNRWKWAASDPNDSHIHDDGVAGPWTAQDWIFEGTMDAEGRGGKRDLRMVFHRHSDSTYEREMQVRRGGGWSTISSSACKRVS